MSFGSAPFGLILLGLTLGIRHATDPDHVVAVTAMLTRERRFVSAIWIGLVWGLGHSATVLAVGMAIIFFKLKVPARLGLTLEFMVALVLILLGLRAAQRDSGPNREEAPPGFSTRNNSDGPLSSAHAPTARPIS